MAACLRCGKPGVASYCRTCQPRKAPTATRGYGTRHQALRKRVQALVDAGDATCSRCGEPIAPGTAWDLDHDDRDRRRYRGPSHAACNRGRRNYSYTESPPDPGPGRISITHPQGVSDCG